VEVVTGRVPVYEDIVRVLGHPPAGALFTWGNTIYHDPPPAGMRHSLSPDILCHEKVHSLQQKAMGAGPWWKLYLESAEFRLEQEVEAYRAQYAFACQHYPQNARRSMLRRIAGDLASPMYGGLCKREAARDLIVGRLEPAAQTPVRLYAAESS
jgi:hypothetical protein